MHLGLFVCSPVTHGNISKGEVRHPCPLRALGLTRTQGKDQSGLVNVEGRAEDGQQNGGRKPLRQNVKYRDLFN